MTDEYDHDLQGEELEELADDPMDAAREIAGESARDGRLAVVSGGLMLLSTLRSVARGQLRALPKAAVGAGLVAIGLRQRRTSEPTTFEPDLDEVDGETEDKETSDEAAAAAERPDAGQESQIDASGDVDEEPQLGEADDDDGGEIEFTDDPEEDEPRSKPSADKDDEDPRRTTDDETTEVDVSETAMAEETAEATGPDPEQAQPTQTDSTEPEETPEEDASDMKVEPDEDDEDDENN
ncbi:hypothetical protein [Natronococcus roseus]|uniref:hypothetical protein n=1 Tax=Natronococcus roseus TaxID=1052014 RepID=UPI00374CB12B